MEATLTKHQTVMKYQGRETIGRKGTRGKVFYHSIDDDTGSEREVHAMPFEIWEELDRPPEITVTVEPGDKLNA